MTDKEVRDIVELLLALEEDSPMPDKMKINHLKIILKRFKERSRMKNMTIKEIQEDLANVLVERTVHEWACILSEDATSLRSATSTREQEAAAGEVFTALAGFCNAAGIDLEKAVTCYLDCE